MKTRAVILMILLAAPCALLVRHASAQPEGPVATGVSDRLRVLETQMVDVKRANGALRGKLPGLTSRVQELLEKVHTVEGAGGAQEKKGPEPDKVKPQTVEYRPPLFRITNKSKPVIFVCREERLFIMDISNLGPSLKQALGGNIANAKPGLQVPLGKGDFDLVLDRRQPRRLELEAKLRPKRSGETSSDIDKGDSAFAAYLAQLNPENDFVQFRVFPDSFNLFRQARKMVWDRNFDMEWLPGDAGGKTLILITVN